MHPAANLSLIWFAVWSSVVHGAIMATQSFTGDHMGHLWGDVLALFLVAIVLSVLVVSSGLKRSRDEAGTSAEPSGAERGRRG